MKIKHYARPVDTDMRSSLDGFLLELLAGVICAGFSYQGYKTGGPILTVACGIVALICIALIIMDIFYFCRSVLAKKVLK
ncbi:MAG: hypothetical protein ACPGR2_00580 [Psychrobium sp.]